MGENGSAVAELASSTERMANVAEQLGTLLTKMEQQFETLNAKVDRIVAAIDETLAQPAPPEASEDSAQKPAPEQQAATQTRLAELEKQNMELKAAAQRARRKTLSGTTLALLAKSGAEEGKAADGASLEKALRSLSVEQRIAVKAEMARAGLL